LSRCGLSDRSHVKNAFVGAVLTCAVTCCSLAYGASAQLSAQSAGVRDFYSLSSPTIYAATQGGGVQKSGDNGATWSKVATMPARYVWKIAGSSSDANLLFAATTNGVYRSANGGTSWAQITFESARAVVVDPANDQNVLIGVPGAGVYRSIDRGLTFALASMGLDSTDVRALVAGPTAGTFYVGLYSNASGAWGGVFRSTDGGVTWATWNSSGAGALPNRYVTSLAVTASGALIAGTYDPAIGGMPYRRVGSNSWQATLGANVSGVYAVHADRNATTTVWMGSRIQGIYKSTNDGANFVASSNSAQDVFTDVLALGTLPGAANRVLAGANGLGIFASTDGGGNWPKSSSGLLADRAVALEPGAGANELFLGTYGGGVYRSVNAGTNFATVNAGLVNAVYGPKTLEVVALAGAGSVVYAATYGFGGLYQWDGTSSWVRLGESGIANSASGFSNPMGVAIDTSNPQNAFYSLFDGSSAGTYRRNGGPAWSKVRNGPFGGAGAGRIIAGAPASNRWYILNADAPADRSVDNGLTWNPVTIAASVPTGFMPLMFFSLAENPIASANALASTSNGLLRSTDNGATWNALAPTGLLATELTGLAYSTTVSGRVFAGDRSGHFYCSNDGGNTWLLRETVAASITAVRGLNSLVFLATDGAGVMQRDPTCP
jgi:photosystem II stability/assembly factor-like uncharacterized protein